VTTSISLFRNPGTFFATPLKFFAGWGHPWGPHKESLFLETVSLGGRARLDCSRHPLSQAIYTLIPYPFVPFTCLPRSTSLEILLRRYFRHFASASDPQETSNFSPPSVILFFPLYFNVFSNSLFPPFPQHLECAT